MKRFGVALLASLAAVALVAATAAVVAAIWIDGPLALEENLVQSALVLFMAGTVSGGAAGIASVQ